MSSSLVFIINTNYALIERKTSIISLGVFLFSRRIKGVLNLFIIYCFCDESFKTPGFYFIIIESTSLSNFELKAASLPGITVTNATSFSFIFLLVNLVRFTWRTWNKIVKSIILFYLLYVSPVRQTFYNITRDYLPMPRQRPGSDKRYIFRS